MAAQQRRNLLTKVLAALARGGPTAARLPADTMSREKSAVELVVSQALGEALAAVSRIGRAEPYFMRVGAATQAFERRAGAA